MKPVRRRMALRCCSFSRFSEAAGDAPVTENLCLASSSSSYRALHNLSSSPGRQQRRYWATVMQHSGPSQWLRVS